MSLSQRSDGRWVVKYKDVFGKWRQRAFRDRDSALQMEAEMIYDRRENERLTLGDAVTAYLINVHHCPKTTEFYSFLVNGYDRKKDGVHTEGPAEFLADKYCSELTRRDLENVRLRMRERGLCNYTINLSIGRLKAAMNWAVDQELLSVNPWAKFKNLPTGKKGTRQASLGEFLLVYAELPAWMQWACRTAMALCLRPGLGELFRLTWDAFDWTERRVEVDMPKVGRRKIVYPPAWYLEEAWERFREDAKAGQTIVCRNKKDRPMRVKEGYSGHWRNACHRAGVRYFPFYCIRHIAATEMLAAGVDLATVAAQLGHANPMTTAQFYAHVVDGAQQRASMALPALPGAAVVRRGAGRDEKSM